MVKRIIHERPVGSNQSKQAIEQGRHSDRMGTRRQSCGRGPLALVLLALVAFCTLANSIAACEPTGGGAGRQVELVLAEAAGARQPVAFDKLHEAAVADQETFYLEPVKSLHTRQVRSLNGLYDFCFDPSARDGFAGRWFERPLVASCKHGQLHRMPVPSAFNEILSQERAKNYIGWLWYQTEVELDQPPVADQSGQVERAHQFDWLVQFDSINYLSLVWAQLLLVDEQGGQLVAELDNELEPRPGAAKLVGSHVGGHLPVVVNVTDLLLAEAARADVTQTTSHSARRPTRRLRLTIAVSNELNADTIPSGQLVNLTAAAQRPLYKFQPDFDFFHFAGIMGDANLIKLAKVHVKRVHFRAYDDVLLELNICLAKRGNEWLWPDERHVLLDGWADYAIGSDQWHFFQDPDNMTAECLLHQIHCSKPVWRERRVCKALAAGRLKWPAAEGRNGHLEQLRVEILAAGGANVSSESHRQVVDAYEVRLAQLDWGREEQQQQQQQVAMATGNSTGDVATTTTTTTTTGVASSWLKAGGASQLQGFGMHHEQLFSGRTMGLAAIMKDLNLVRQTGANLIRTSHYPYSRAYLEACDQLGLLVIAECPAVGLRTFSKLKLRLHKQVLKEMMLRDHEHPAIIMWSLANEPRCDLEESRPYFESLVEFARNQLADFTWRAHRPLTAAIAQPSQADRLGDLLDVIMVNRYLGWYDYLGALETIKPQLRATLMGWAQRYEKPLLMSEFGADTLAGSHTGEPFSEEYQLRLVEEHEGVFDELARVANKSQINFLGSMVWNFADFATHDSLLRVGGNKKGIFTANRQPKMVAGRLAQIYQERRTAPAAGSEEFGQFYLSR